MNIEEKINFIKGKYEANKVAIISDSKNNKYICAIDHNETSNYFALSIYLHDLNLEPKGFINFFRDPNKRLFLSTIYIYYDVRGLGLATKLNNLADFILRNESHKIICGRFLPYNIPQDKSLPPDLTKDEKDFFARKFYTSAGYKIVSFNDFKTKPSSFPDIAENDFKLGDKFAEKIVYKKLKKLDKNLFREECWLITENQPTETLDK